MPKKTEKQGYGVAGFILSIFSILFGLTMFLSPIGLLCGILGIIFSNKQRRIFVNGLSTAGLIMNIFGVIISGFFVLFMILF